MTHTGHGVLQAWRGDEYDDRRVWPLRREALPLIAVALNLSGPAIAWIVVAFCIAAVSQALSGFGFSLLVVPLLTLVVSRIDAVVGSSCVALVTQSWMALVLRREADHATVRRMLPASLVGMPVGIVIGHVVSDRVLRVGVGVAVLVAVVAIKRGLSLSGRPTVVDRASGFVSGILGTTTGTNGPPLVIALAGRGLSPGVTRATLTTMFSYANVVSLALFTLDGSVHRVALVVAGIGIVPALAVRAAAESSFRKLDAERYRSLVLGLLTLAGLVAIVNAFR